MDKIRKAEKAEEFVHTHHMSVAIMKWKKKYIYSVLYKIFPIV